MTKTFITALLLFVTLLAPAARAVEVGDIYFSDKTFASSMQSGKKAIGLVYWVSPNKDFGLIMSLEEPASNLNAYNADVYCSEYFTDGTLAGDWWLPKRIEMLRMSTEKINGTSNNKFTVLNNKLKTITKADGKAAAQLSAAAYVTRSGLCYNFNPSSGGISQSGSANNAQSSGATFKVRCITAL